MEFVAARKDFATALARAQGIPEQKNLSSVMANVLLESVGEDQVRLTAMSYEVTLVTTFAAKVAVEGQMALSGRSLFDAARMLPDAPVSLKSLPNDWADLSAGRTQYRIPGVLSSNMPERQDVNVTEHVAVPKDLLLEMGERVAFAMSSDEGRPNLNGVFLRVEPAGKLTRLEMVATDGHRLSQLTRQVEQAEISQPMSVILHRKGVTELKRFLDNENGPVSLGFQRNAVVFKVETGYLKVRQIELDYPDYGRVIPSSFKWTFVVDRADLTRAVQRASVVISGDKTPIVRLLLDSKRIQIVAQDPEKGEAHTEIDVEYSGDKLEISYNNRYLLDAVNALPGQQVVFSVKDLSSATRLTSPVDEGTAQLIMPISRV